MKMKTLILFGILIGYTNGYKHVTERSTQSTQSTPYTENCEETEDTVSLNLSYTGLQRINERFINNVHVTCLDLSDNDIVFVSPAAFELLPNLTYLNLANNRISLSEFRLNVNYTTLETLVLDHNNVEYRNSVVYFRNLFPSIKHLYLRQNFLQKFSNTYVFLNVQHLYLSDNNIISVDDIIGEILRITLTHLHLERNAIRRVNGTTLRNLEYLALDGNQIESLCNQYCHDSWVSLNRMTKLKHLSLSGNQITAIESDSFLETINLISLDLSDNKITAIRKDTFKSLTMLEILSLSGNRLTILPEFSPLQNIQKLAVENNKFTNIPAGLFSDFRALKNLSLSNNYISNVEKQAFLNLISLQELSLSNNRIENLPEEWMTPQNNLRILNLKDNYFTDFKNLSLKNAESLENLFLQRNAIEVLKVASLLNLSKYISIHLEDQSKRRLSDTKKNASIYESSTLPYEYSTRDRYYNEYYEEYYN